jgi:hypothetical protein
MIPYSNPAPGFRGKFNIFIIRFCLERL